MAMPIGIVWLIIFAAVCWCAFQRRRMGFLIVMAIWILVSVSHNRYFAAWIYHFVEYPFVQLAEDHPTLRTVIVLGGGAGVDPVGEPQLGGDGQRLVDTAKYWHAGRTHSIICTGSNPLNRDPCDIGKRLLTTIGVDPTVIYKVPGNNTSEEMKSVKAFLDSPPEAFPVDGKVGLVTSAYHMPRAMRLAKGQGLDLLPLPCGFRVKGDVEFSPWYLVPTSGAASTVGAATKELLAAIIGR